MDIMNRSDVLDVRMNTVTGTMKFLTGKLQEGQERAGTAKTEAEQAEVIASCSPWTVFSMLQKMTIPTTGRAAVLLFNF